MRAHSALPLLVSDFAWTAQWLRTGESHALHERLCPLCAAYLSRQHPMGAGVRAQADERRP